MKKVIMMMFVLAFVVITLLCIPLFVSASPVPVGDPILDNSWSQLFYEAGVGNFDMMEAFMSSGDAFESPGFGNFDNASWNGNLLSPDYIVATGDLDNLLYFNIYFEGSTSNPLTFDFLAWEGDVLKEWATASWTGSGWDIVAHDTRTYDPATHNRAVPEPSTLMLLGAGLAGIGIFRRKMFRRNNSVKFNHPQGV